VAADDKHERCNRYKGCSLRPHQTPHTRLCLREPVYAAILRPKQGK
jgi:hypothetical protein